MRDIILIAHDIRSTHNVGALLRTAEGLAVKKVYFSGYTPYPTHATDTRLPHLARKLDMQINKTALGAQKSQAWQHIDDITALLESLKQTGYELIALEQTTTSHPLPDYKPPAQLAILLGREVDGIAPELLQYCDRTVEIPMFGTKESFNVVEAATMVLYHCRFAK